MSDYSTPAPETASGTQTVQWRQLPLTAVVDADESTTRLIRIAAGLGSWSGRGPSTTVIWPSAIPRVRQALTGAGVTIRAVES